MFGIHLLIYKCHKKIILFRSSGLDSRLIDSYIYESCKNKNYFKNYHVLFGNITCYKKKYAEFDRLKKNGIYTYSNFKVVNIKYKNFLKTIYNIVKINEYPVNGLSYETINQLCKYCKIYDYK